MADVNSVLIMNYLARHKLVEVACFNAVVRLQAAIVAYVTAPSGAVFDYQFSHNEMIESS